MGFFYIYVMAVRTLDGFHGTDIRSSKEIVRNGFKVSKGDQHWLGDGAYFFVKGLPPSPDVSAEKWAKAEAWNKRKGAYSYRKYAIIKVQINVDEDFYLDLNTKDGQELFEYLRGAFIKKVVDEGYKFDNWEFKDGEIINVARNEGIIELEVVKGNFFIKFATERIFNINFRTPNVTICAVFDTTKNIDNHSINVIKIGEIEDEVR